tara:strand:- start:51 stop:533 length:483 start_codon:yes stop_codon:yes gene_type:complete
MNILEIAYKKHKIWLNICKSFGLDKETSEDIVQEMYIKLHDITEKGKDITYGKDDINYYYVFKILYTMFLQLKKKKNRVNMCSDELLYNVESPSDVKFQEMENKFNDEFSKLHWYDQKVFEIVSSGTRISDLSRKTTITYISLYNTYNKVKKHLKKKLGL